MTRVNDERDAFRAVPDREAYLRANSHLPGPRANLELLAAAAEEVAPDWARRWADQAPGTDSTDVFLVCVGLVALGRMLAGGDEAALPTLRLRAGDGEWRIREAVAIGLQRLGDERPDRLAQVATDWAVVGTPLEARAAVAAVAEPRLLRDGRLIAPAIAVLDAATEQGRACREQTRGRRPCTASGARLCVERRGRRRPSPRLGRFPKMGRGRRS